MLTFDALRARREDILRVTRRNGAQNVRIFGSIARAEATNTSDVDILVDMEPNRDLIDLISVQQDLADMLGCKVDVVTEAAISPYIRNSVLRDARAL